MAKIYSRNNVQVIVKKSSTLIKNEDGTTTLIRVDPEQIEKRNIKNEDDAVQQAIDHLHQYRDIEPLAILFKQKNAGIYRNDEAIELIKAAMLGKLSTGKGRTKTLSMLEREHYICKAIHNLNLKGLPIKADANTDKQSACELVGSKFYISAAAVYSIWRNQSKDSIKTFKGFSLSRIEQWADQPEMTPYEVVNHCYDELTRVQNPPEDEEIRLQREEHLLEDFYDEYTRLNGHYYDEGET